LQHNMLLKLPISHLYCTGYLVLHHHPKQAPKTVLSLQLNSREPI
jgi:hypothetical protein